MANILMIYKIPKGNSSIRISFNRELLNYRVQSNRGTFDKKTNGILKRYRKPVRSTIIFSESKLEEVKKLCKKYKIEAEFYRVEKIDN